jgi:antitoxin (DNA-binding transcriptional repressor) of toxin-antitoxin stability system
MKTLGVREMRASYGALEAALKAEGEVILTHHGKPFARVLPIDAPVAPVAPKRMPSNAELRAKMKPMTVPSSVFIREDRDARG